MASLEDERNAWIDQCDKALVSKFRGIAKEFILEKLQLKLEGKVLNKEFVKLLKIEFNRDPSKYSEFREYFRLRHKEIEEDIRRSYYYFNESTENITSFNKRSFKNIIAENPPNDKDKTGGFLIMKSEKPNITYAKYIYYPKQKENFNIENGTFEESSLIIKEINFTYDHIKNLIILESNLFIDNRSLIASLKYLTSFGIEPFGIYKKYNDPTKYIMEICRELFDDLWMLNHPKKMRKLEEKNPPSKYVDALFGKNEEPLQKIGNIDLSCKLPFREIIPNNIVASLLRKKIVIIGFEIQTYFKNYPFKIKIKSSRNFSTFSIIRNSKDEAYSEMIELKDKLEEFFYSRFR